MCGRYAASRSAADLVEEFDVEHSEVGAELKPDFNVAPTVEVPAVIQRHPRGDRTAAPIRQLVSTRWGLVPSWAKNPSIGNKMINARMETVAEKPAFKRAFAARRCLLPADGYYEWYPTQRPGKNGKPAKQPFYIHPSDGGVLAMAGLYEFWRDPQRADDDPDAWLRSCTVLTTRAEDAVGMIHDRMPLLVEPQRWAAWLDPTLSDREELLGLLVPAAPGRLEAYPVSMAVNNVRNNEPELVEPLPPDEAAVVGVP